MNTHDGFLLFSVQVSRPAAHPCFPPLLLPLSSVVFCLGNVFVPGCLLVVITILLCDLLRCFFLLAPLLTDFSGVIEMPTPVEGSRLQTRMETFNLPVLVGTLLSGFTLVRHLRVDGPWQAVFAPEFST